MRSFIFLFLFLFLFFTFQSARAQTLQHRFSNIRIFIEQEIESEKTAGVSISVHLNGYTNTEYFGFADFPNLIPITEKSRLYSASTSKLIVSAAILQLEREGKLNVEDKVGLHINDLQPKIARLKIVELISHMSGLEDFTNDFGASGPSMQISFSRKLGEDDFYTDPGLAFSYSNPGYSILGAVIEAVTKKSFNDAITELIFVPSEMKNSTFRPDQVARDQVAKGHSISLVANSSYPDDAEGRASGLLLTTSEDMNNFLAWLMSKDNPIHNKIFQTLVPEEITGSTWTYGFGLFKWTQCNEEVYWHTGGLPGYRANIMLQPEKQYAITILSNGEDLNRNEILRLGLNDFLEADCTENSSGTVDLFEFTDKEISQLIGNYHQKIGMRISLYKRNNMLIAKVNGEEFEVKKNEKGQLVLLKNGSIMSIYGVRYDETGKANYIQYWVRSYPRVD